MECVPAANWNRGKYVFDQLLITIQLPWHETNHKTIIMLPTLSQIVKSANPKKSNGNSLVVMENVLKKVYWGHTLV